MKTCWDIILALSGVSNGKKRESEKLWKFGKEVCCEGIEWNKHTHFVIWLFFFFFFPWFRGCIYVCLVLLVFWLLTIFFVLFSWIKYIELSIHGFLHCFYEFRYVIDSGYVKQRQYNPSTGMYSLDVVQISK